MQFGMKTQDLFSGAAVVLFDFKKGEREEKKTSGRLVSLPHLHEKQESVPLSPSHPFIRPARTTLLMILCIIQKQFGRLHFREIVVLTHNPSTADVCQYLKKKCPKTSRMSDVSADFTGLSKIFHRDHCDKIK